MTLLIDQTDRATWDAFVASSTHGHFMQSYAWGEMQQSAGWRPHYVAMSGGDGRLRATGLLLSRSLPLTGKRLFYCPRGPVLADLNPDAAVEVASALKAYVRANGGAFLRADPYLVEDERLDRELRDAGLQKVPRDWSYWNAPRFVFWLDLDRPEEVIFKAMASGCQRDIKAGYKKRVEFAVGTAADLGDFHRLMVSMSATKGIAVHDEDYYRRLYEVMNRSCKLELFLARFENQVVSVGMSLKLGSRAWLLYAASDRAHSKLGVNRNVQWEMIKWARDAGCLRYDFRGTATGDPPNPADPGFGVYTFKKSFGPEFVRLAGYYDLVTNAPLHSLFRLGEEKVVPSLYRAKVWLDERKAAR
jgi:lipid II:glycine glycyltransferase (peptidoglycan interpeptide bridge formation enzyme)